VNIPEIEEKILEFWKKDKTFKKSLEKNKKDYVFYDGPPFATGFPHYGHIVASLMKDMVPRFWTMRGYRVERKWGWDTHGLPIENIVEQELGLKNKKDIEKIGVDKFNETARSKVLMFVDEWKKVIERMGRWADMENPYKTMDLNYMESIWWGFKELWDKKLIYEGYKSMHVCPRCETTLSQHEVSDNYKDVKDLSVTAKFELQGEPGAYVLAWTTTPWTLIGNVALAIGEKLNYVKVKYNNEFYILVDQNVDRIFNGKQFEIVEKINSKDLIGKKYKPLFDYYIDTDLPNKENLYTIVSADFVTTEDGTGVVHIAPAFGEEDMSLGKEKKLSFIQHVKMNGQIIDEAKEFAGLEVKPKDNLTATDKKIIEYLESKNLLFAQEEYLHSYPYCYRCDSPLLNYATSSLFVKVTELKDKALKRAKNINWMPKHIKEGRFGNWLEGARDWSISRQRFWGSVIPIWVCDKCKEKKVIGSIAELEKLSGAKITDLHKHFIDKIEFNCSCDGKMKRVPDVLDCWFESGSMPYAQMHYPFENKKRFEDNFPAEFIAEGVDQTRAWFYYMHVLSTALKNSEAFKNVIVNGMVLAEDGKKMSKHLNNYPDPMEVFEKYGADAVRYYLATSPVMRAEDLCFSEKGVDEVVKKVSLMILNILSFYKLFATGTEESVKSKNILDKWILSKTESLKKEITDGYENYDLNRATKPIAGFIDELSTWYVRRSRERFKSSAFAKATVDKEEAVQTLKYVLLEFSKIIAPVMPFIADHLYQEIYGGQSSVHLEDWPEVNKKLIDEKLEEQMEQTRNICSLGLQKRAEAGIKVRQPLASLQIRNPKSEIRNNEELLNLIKDEVNVKEIIFGAKTENEVELNTNITPELQEEGLVRDFVRSIQVKRKEMGLTPKDKIRITVGLSSEALAKEGKIVEKYADQIKKQVIAEEIVFGEGVGLTIDKL
jgi:isoleucyl-tRNA synthetase